MNKLESLQIPRSAYVMGGSTFCELHGEAVSKQNVVPWRNGAGYVAQSLGVGLGLILLSRNITWRRRQQGVVFRWYLNTCSRNVDQGRGQGKGAGRLRLMKRRVPLPSGGEPSALGSSEIQMNVLGPEYCQLHVFGLMMT